MYLGPQSSGATPQGVSMYSQGQAVLDINEIERKRIEADIDRMKADLACLGHSAEVKQTDSHKMGVNHKNLNAFKRELKINGVITDSANSDQLSSLGLIRQINAAIFKGYTVFS